MPKRPRLETARQIADRRGVQMHRVLYVIDSRRIEPAYRVGNIRQFDEAGISQIEEGLDRVAERKEATQ